MEAGHNRAEPQCYLGLDEPGAPLPFPFYAFDRQWVTETGQGTKSQNRAKCSPDGPDSPERILGPKQPPREGEQLLPRSGSVQLLLEPMRRLRRV